VNIMAALVQAILERPHSYEWTVQGFGQLRTKLASVGRIHVWDSRLRVPLVSDIHAHPWDLTSTIISGELINQRFTDTSAADYEPADPDDDLPPVLPYVHSRIATGEGGGLIGTPSPALLLPHAPEFYRSGQRYRQRGAEIHRSIPIDGTVTLIERQMGEPLQETSVYWPRGTQWVSAEPRPARAEEIDATIKYALDRWSA